MQALSEKPTALKPCPFCGMNLNLGYLRASQEVQYTSCGSCGATGLSWKNEGRLQCEEVWNTRADAAPDTSAEAVGVTGEMPGSNGGFSMAVFRAIDVPVGTKLYTNSAPSLDGLDVDALAQEIRRVDGNHKLGAAALAEALMPFLKSWLGVG